jgi:hypothetical protein
LGYIIGVSVEIYYLLIYHAQRNLITRFSVGPPENGTVYQRMFSLLPMTWGPTNEVWGGTLCAGRVKVADVPCYAAPVVLVSGHHYHLISGGVGYLPG